MIIRTSKWPATFDNTTGNPELDRKIEYTTFLGSGVRSSLVAKRESLFPISERLGISQAMRMY